MRITELISQEKEHTNNIFKILDKLGADDTQKEVVNRALYELSLCNKKMALEDIKNKINSKLNML